MPAEGFSFALWRLGGHQSFAIPRNHPRSRAQHPGPPSGPHYSFSRPWLAGESRPFFLRRRFYIVMFKFDFLLERLRWRYVQDGESAQPLIMNDCFPFSIDIKDASPTQPDIDKKTFTMTATAQIATPPIHFKIHQEDKKITKTGNIKTHLNKLFKFKLTNTTKFCTCSDAFLCVC